MLFACWLRSLLRPRGRGSVRRCVLRAACSVLISSLSGFFLHSSGCYDKASLFLLLVAMVSSLWFPHFNFKEAWKDHLVRFFFFLSSSCWCLWLISVKLANNNIQLTPEEQGLELCGSTHTWISVLMTALCHPALSESPDAEPGIRKVNSKLHVGLPWWLRW